jgi:hypothetical protein
MDKVKVSPLNETESGKLMGGFVSVSSEIADGEGLINSNYSKTGLLNSNCACNNCAITEPDDNSSM